MTICVSSGKLGLRLKRLNLDVSANKLAWANVFGRALFKKEVFHGTSGKSPVGSGHQVSSDHCGTLRKKTGSKMRGHRRPHGRIKARRPFHDPEKERYGTVFLTDAGREAAELYASCYRPLCSRMQEALGLEEETCRNVACAVLAEEQERLPELALRLK